MVTVTAHSLSPNPIDRAIFGGNILSSRDDLDEGNSFAPVAEQLGITAFRYPGGSLTEDYFEISNPDKSQAPNVSGSGDVDLIPFSQYMEFIASNNYSTTIVIPTRNFLGESTDEYGNRFASINESELRGFIVDTLDGRYGLAKIDGFEIGNEYWASGEMNSIEYGRVSAKVSKILDEELSNHERFEELYEETKILIQMGADNAFADFSQRYSEFGSGRDQLAQFNQDHGLEFSEAYLYGSGEVKWGHIANELIIGELLEEDSLSSIDGLIAHVYSRGADMPQSRYFSLRTIEQTWGEHLSEVEVSVTEWNQSAATQALEHHNNFGLAQAHEMLNIVEGFTEFNVAAAHVWPLQQNTANDLSGDVGQTELTVPGVMFSLMSSSLPGTTPVNLNVDQRSFEHEYRSDEFDIHSFYAQDKMIFFVTANDLDGFEAKINFSTIFSDEEDISIRILTVEEGDNPGSTSSAPDLIELDSTLIFEDQALDIELEGLEIMMIEVSEPQYTSSFLGLIGEEIDNGEDEEPILPEVPPVEDNTDGEDNSDGESGSEELDFALGLPIEIAGFLAIGLALAAAF
ncbi:hypothetical protein [Thalassobius sp. MITS945101]|uniref:hypothetical protein n=1 Tax=Thalassobius sp. MITS945101 TaxID=3096994 RepID=UPI00399AC521